LIENQKSDENNASSEKFNIFEKINMKAPIISQNCKEILKYYI
jgi:hypothetical protein